MSENNDDDFNYDEVMKSIGAAVGEFNKALTALRECYAKPESEEKAEE